MVKKRNKSKMCNGIKSAKQEDVQKTVYWDLINSNMNMNGRNVQTGCSGYVHKKIRVMRICMYPVTILYVFMRLSLC